MGSNMNVKTDLPLGQRMNLHNWSRRGAVTISPLPPWQQSPYVFQLTRLHHLEQDERGNQEYRQHCWGSMMEGNMCLFYPT